MIHRDRQLSRQFYVFEQVTSFLHRDRNISRRSYVLKKIRNYYWLDIFAFSWYPTKKQSNKQQRRQNGLVPIDASCFPWSETTTRKSPKINLTQKFRDGDETLEPMAVGKFAWTVGHRSCSAVGMLPDRLRFAAKLIMGR